MGPRQSSRCRLVHINLLLLRHVGEVEHVDMPVNVVLEISVALGHLLDVLIIIHLLVQVAFLDQRVALRKKILLLGIVQLLQLLYHHGVSEQIGMTSCIGC